MVSTELLEEFAQVNQLSMEDLREVALLLQYGGDYNKQVVGIEEFCLSPHYMNAVSVDGTPLLYPNVLVELAAMNSGEYVESVLTGGIGSGKTTIALYTTAYQLYLLSCLKNAHHKFGLDPSSEILLIFQSITAHLAKTVSYNRFRDMIKHSPYFKKHFPFKESIESKMVFPGRIEVIPVSGADTAAIGQNVIGGVIDELNYMAVVEKSKSSVDGGTYDQAVALYQSIARRRKSRFMQQGRLPGILCLVSSKRYPGQFTDIKEEEARTDPTIYVYDKRVWDIKPDTFCGEWFKVFIGTVNRSPRVLEDGEPVREEDEPFVMDIPVEYRVDFERDPINSLREIAGVSTLARHPFILGTERIGEAFTEKYKSVLSLNSTDFEQDTVKILPTQLKNTQHPRFVHVDLGLSSDSAGVACGYVGGFMSISRGDHTETLPLLVYDFVLEVRPPKGGEIKFFKIRDLLYKLRELGVLIKWVTYDSYQSVDSLQILRSKGFITGNESMDTKRFPYEILKSAILDGRVSGPPHPRLAKELASLESDPKTGKIDHPPNGSKDCSDAVAGVAYGLTMRKEIWVTHGVPIVGIPEFVQKMVEKRNPDE